MSDAHHPRKVARSGAVYTGALLVQKILSFAYFSFVARSLGPELLGKYIFVLSFAAFFSLLVDFGFVNLAIRDFARNKEDEERDFRIFFTFRLLLAVCAAAVLWLAALFLRYDAGLLTLLAITTAIMLMDAFTAFFYAVFRARQNLFYESIGTVSFQIIVLVAGLFALSQTRDLRVLLLVIALGSFWHLLYSLSLIKIRVRLSLRPLFDRLRIKYWLSRAAPFFLAAGFIKAYNTLDTILLKNISGDEAAGLYAIPAKIVFTFPFLAMGITAAVYPAMSNYAVAAPERLQPIFSRTLQLLLAISLPIAVGIFLLAEPIFGRIWPQFSESVPALRILIWAAVFLFIEYPFGSLLNATGNERRNTWNRGVQLFIFIALNIFLIPRYGFMGAVYTALASSILIVILGAWRTRRLVRLFGRANNLAFCKTAASALIMAGFVWRLAGQYSFLVIIPLAAVVYLAMLILLRFYDKQERLWLKNLLWRG